MKIGCALTLLVVPLFAGSQAVSHDPRGWVLGSAAFLREQGFSADAADVELVFSRNGKQTRIRADQNGDYSTQLEPCRYELVAVIAPDGKRLKLSPKQYRSLVIEPSGTTRFDVMLSR